MFKIIKNLFWVFAIAINLSLNCATYHAYVSNITDAPGQAEGKGNITVTTHGGTCTKHTATVAPGKVWISPGIHGCAYYVTIKFPNGNSIERYIGMQSRKLVAYYYPVDKKYHLDDY